MLYGNIIFIKKTGGDGSKFPVKEKNVKIGKSEECLIRIYSPQIASEHCQLVIDDNGQAKLKNFSQGIILNSKPLTQNEVTLCHGDVFTLGERLARWEYVSSSKYYKQLLSPSGRLVAVVAPQKRSMEEQSTSKASTPRAETNKRMSLGGKRKYSTRLILDSGSAKKMSKISSASKTPKVLAKCLPRGHSLKGSSMFSSKIMQRSMTGVFGEVSKTLKSGNEGKFRKSTLPSWKISLVSPQSNEKKAELKTPKSKTNTSVKCTEEPVKSTQKTAVNPANLKATVESSFKGIAESVRLTRSSSKSPTVNASSVLFSPENKRAKSKLSINSEKKIGSERTKRAHLGKNLKRLSLALGSSSEPSCKTAINKMYPKLMKETSPVASKNSKTFSSMDNCRVLLETPKVKLSTVQSVKEVQTPKSPVSSPLIESTPARKSQGKTNRKTLNTSLSNEILSSKKKMSAIKNKSIAKNTSDIKGRKFSATETPVRGRSSEKKSFLTTKSKSKKTSDSPRGVRRKLSPSISSAERAAKKLKTCSPRKPDKNKKAALLVLGKANRKQFSSQSVKVMLKQKIVKKAIKQSTIQPSKGDKISVKKPQKTKNVVTKKKGKKLAAKKLKNNVSKSPKTSDNKSPLNVKSSKEDVSPKVETSKSKKNADASPNRSRTQLPTVVNSSLNSSLTTKEEKLIVKSSKKADSSFGNISPSRQSSSDGEILTPEHYSFSTSRRCSKRLSSKNDESRPDFMELSPTALGLIPKIDMLKTSKEIKRRSSGLTTPKNMHMIGIIKSATTSKIRNRKSVRFSPKDISYASSVYSQNISQDTDFDFDSLRTPNITMDAFVSPIVENTLNNTLPNEISKSSKSLIFEDEEIVQGESRFTKQSKKSWQQRTSKSLVNSSKSPNKTKSSLVAVTPVKNDTKGSKTTKKKTAEEKSVKTFKPHKSPKNDLSDVEGVSRLLRTPTVAKSPRNDLSDLRGVKKLMGTPKVQLSPKNDLTDVRGVKRLLQTPKIQKSPKNDLTDVAGVKNLFRSPRTQKSPKNILNDFKGIKKLLRTPKIQKSPKNDLSDVIGVKRLVKTPKIQKSPKNDLTDVNGVKQLMRTPKIQRSPKNDLTNIDGVAELFKSPRVQKSPTNDLSDLRGVRRLLGSPKLHKSPKNDLSDLAGVSKLLTTPRMQKSPKNDLMDVSGITELFQSPKVKDENVNTPQLQKTPNQNFSAGVKQLLIARSSKDSSSKKSLIKQANETDLRGRRTIYTTPEAPKNELSDLVGVRELFSRHKPTNDLNINLTGVAELFDVPALVVNELPASKPSETQEAAATYPKRGRQKSTKASESIRQEEGKEVITLRGRTRKDTLTCKKPTRSAKSESPKPKATLKQIKTGERKKTENTKSSVAVKSQGRTRAKVEKRKTSDKPSDVSEKETRSSRKRKIPMDVELSPPKLRRRLADVKAQESLINIEIQSPRRTATSRRKAVEKDDPKNSNERKKAAPKVKDKKPSKNVAAPSKVQSKTTVTKTDAKSVRKVQKKESQPSAKAELKNSKAESSPRKTRSAKVTQEKKSEVHAKTVTAKRLAAKKSVPSAVKRSARLK